MGIKGGPMEFIYAGDILQVYMRKFVVLTSIHLGPFTAHTSLSFLLIRPFVMDIQGNPFLL